MCYKCERVLSNRIEFERSTVHRGCAICGDTRVGCSYSKNNKTNVSKEERICIAFCRVVERALYNFIFGARTTVSAEQSTYLAHRGNSFVYPWTRPVSSFRSTFLQLYCVFTNIRHHAICKRKRSSDPLTLKRCRTPNHRLREGLATCGDENARYCCCCYLESMRTRTPPSRTSHRRSFDL